MITVILVIHLLISLALVGTILLQRSEGGALGIGGGGGGLVSGRAAGNLLTRATAMLATAFFVTSLVLAIMANQRGGSSSIVDGMAPAATPAATAPAQPEAPAVPAAPAEPAAPVAK